VTKSDFEVATMRLIKPLAIALKGKGLATLVGRLQTMARRYGLTTAKMDRSLEQFARILRQFDCRATLPITAIALARNSASVQRYQAQGIEFAIHGYLHVDYSQLSLEEQCAHLRAACQVFRDHGIHFAGFRCPYLRWNEDTLTALTQAGVSYDGSTSLVWDIEGQDARDSYYHALSFYGAQPAADYLALPSLDTETNLVRIPYCLPDDESLAERFMWHSPAEMRQVWPAVFHQTHEQGELFTLGLHPERIEACSSGLVATLEAVRAIAPAVWCARLDEIAAWWKAHYAAVVDVDDVDENALQLNVNGPQGITLLLRSLEAKTATEPWFDGYQRASQIPCVVRVHKRPFIGVSPGTALALIHFLKQQGYVVETSANPDSYSFYLDRGSFSRQEERALIAQIERADFPLARLGRWPHGTRSALAVTGDIDALTLWDYGLRSLGR
jgi:peptidoglycan/xylan/chitin deacetylase (PgdA/CDA1 family)